ncbi:hypothetical protein COY95_01790 [Candidatus Woesearchaeota archaeon CG_4_10_14_0_8_um_filter_47_5]|nr:MAG: hypothetical protein COY95_01790 [Candidatus Woesearchaeota archaeon CG_4_10_14_0_8_um_filter_47_5]
MSQMEQDFVQFLSARPEIKRCYYQGLINRRALARYLVKQEILSGRTSLEAVVGMLRRVEMEKEGVFCDTTIFNHIRITVKDHITIFDLKKSAHVMEQLKELISQIDPLKNETFKMVLGSASVKLFLDSYNNMLITEHIKKDDTINKHDQCSEISIFFPEKARSSKGVISFLTTEFALHDIIITEFLSCSPELLMYLEEKHTVKAFGILKRLSQ